jgi:hypothetical protein
MKGRAFSDSLEERGVIDTGKGQRQVGHGIILASPEAGTASKSLKEEKNG